MGGKWYDISISPQFIEDMNNIKDYIAYDLNNPLAADNLKYEVKKAIEKRRFFAEAYKRYYSRYEPGIPFYRIQVKNYTVFYTVEGNTVEVRRIFYSRRDIENYI